MFVGMPFLSEILSEILSENLSFSSVAQLSLMLSVKGPLRAYSQQAEAKVKDSIFFDVRFIFFDLFHFDIRFHSGNKPFQKVYYINSFYIMVA